MTTSKCEELRERVRNGNDKFIEAWRKGLQDGDIDWQLERISNSWRKLSNLCLELQYRYDYTDCLYEEPPCRTNPDWLCFVCPSEIPYWREAMNKES